MSDELAVRRRKIIRLIDAYEAGWFRLPATINGLHLGEICSRLGDIFHDPAIDGGRLAAAVGRMVDGQERYDFFAVRDALVREIREILTAGEEL
ncbi:MAG: hypothetical protein N3A57_03660 [Negativicutes bacterium]|nr:hypothetical protein [Negativicutes bacterium]